jgi:hypothetical protein
MMSVMPRLLLIALVLFVATWATRAEAAASPGFEPGNTWVVVSGVLEWKAPSLRPFSKDHRKDQELYDTLAARGVPAAQRVLLLDDQATAENIFAAIDRLAARAPAGSTFIFYYAGHGYRLTGGDIVFASADVEDRDNRTGLHLDELTTHLARFHGGRLLLLADCCYSGGLGAVAKAIADHGVEAVALTSSEASNTSTANWTFSQSVIDALHGAQLQDRDGNGTLSLGDLRAEVQAAMKMRERQRYGWADYGLPESWSIARVTPDPNAAFAGGGAWKRGGWVLVDGEKGKEVARILKVEGGHLGVELYHYSVAIYLDVPQQKATPIVRGSFAAGSNVEVNWKGQWYPAKVLKQEDDLDFITYVGFDHHWDEWVGDDRIRPAEGGPQPANTSLAGKKVKVEWKGQWYEAEIRSASEGSYCIHYTGYEASWDECVPAARVQGL